MIRLLFFTIPIILEYLVIINVYNGNATNLNEVLEYSCMDLFPLLGLIISVILKKNQDILEWICTILAFIAHLQWYVHNPFEPWPEWWPATKTEGDDRHRTEYYDTHVMVFCIYLLLLFRRFPIKKKKKKKDEKDEIDNYIV